MLVCNLDIAEAGDSPPSPTVHWVPEVKLDDADRGQLMDGALLTDKHMDGWMHSVASTTIPRYARTTVHTKRTATRAASAS